MSAAKPGDADAFLRGFDFGEEIARRDEAHRSQSRRLLCSLLDVVDSFDRILGTESDTDGDGGAGQRGRVDREAVRLIRLQLLQALSRAGVSATECTGAFDPELHEAVEARATDAAENGAIVDVVQAGYDWNGEQLRVPKVVVGRAADTREDQTGQPESDET